MPSEVERMERMKDKIHGTEQSCRTGSLVYDPEEKTFRPRRPSDDRDKVTVAIPGDTRFSNSGPGGLVSVILFEDMMKNPSGSESSCTVQFSEWEGEQVFTHVPAGSCPLSVPGTVLFWEKDRLPKVTSFGKEDERVRIIVNHSQECEVQKEGVEIPPRILAFVSHNGVWQQASVQTIPLRSQLFSRHSGLLETGALSDKRVLVIGLGTVGADVTLELCKSGVQDFALMDPDRLEACNVSRHVAPLSHVGRHKTRSVRHLLLDINPYCHVETWELEVLPTVADLVREQIRQSDLVLCSPDSQDCRLMVNRLCLEEDRPVIIGGLHHRAYGGQVLFVRPYTGPCYQCFLMALEEPEGPQDVPTMESADTAVYADRPAPIEPGLSLDIAPVNILMGKLAVQELLKGKPTTFGSLDEDLVAPLYHWLNRREAGSPYANLEPLGFNVDKMTILRWYGIPLERHPGCPACGDYEGHMASQLGVEIPEEAAQTFAAK